MQRKKLTIGSSVVDYFFDSRLQELDRLTKRSKTIIITDDLVFQALGKGLNGWDCIVIPSGEASKVQTTVSYIIDQLLLRKAGRDTLLVGVGGGVVTDLTGYVASIYMRGIRFGFVPTSVLAMVDAAIGGKNGIDVGLFKNMVGTIRQPAFLLYDISLLKTLPDKEWKNGFAEIIKHASIYDRNLFVQLEEYSIPKFRKDKPELEKLIRRNALLKTKVVQADELEQGERKKLNFGHTLGHAIENLYGLSHGEAISIGMCFAGSLSEELTGFKDAVKLKGLISRYGLPVSFDFDSGRVIEILEKDKKVIGGMVHFILLEKIGKATIKPVSIKEIFSKLS